MRINQFIAQATGMSRRTADAAIEAGRVTLNDQPANLGVDIKTSDEVKLDGQPLQAGVQKITIMLNKPAGYVTSRRGQGSRTIYELLPTKYHHLKPVGRLDKDSSGLLLLTNDGRLAHELTHPSHQKTKVYVVTLDKPLRLADFKQIHDTGVQLDDGLSRLHLEQLDKTGREWHVTMSEGRNRQIRRTFSCLGYRVERLHRLRVGPYDLAAQNGALSVAPGQYRTA